VAAACGVPDDPVDIRGATQLLRPRSRVSENVTVPSTLPRLPARWLSTAENRTVSIALIAVASAGLVAGSTYGTTLASYALFGATVGGVVIERRTRYRGGRVTYGDTVLGFVGGVALASLSTSVAITWLLHGSAGQVLNVVWGTAVDVLINASLDGFFALVGVAVSATSGTVVGRLDDRWLAVFVVAGFVAFVAAQLRLDHVTTGQQSFATTSHSPATTDAIRVAQAVALAGAVACLGGVRGLIRTPMRYRAAAAALVLAGALVGGVAIGNVHGHITSRQTATATADRLDAAVSDVGTADGSLRVYVAVHNPTDRRIELEGVVVRYQTADAPKLAYGTTSGDGAIVAPDDTRTMTYRIPVADATADRVRDALDDGRGTLTVEQSFAVAGATGQVTVTCSVTADGACE
jgi:hypothetical protein